VILVALVIRVLAHRVINRVTERAARVEAGSDRREQRSRALGSILRSAVSIVVSGIAVLTILGDLGFNLTPLLLSTTALGVALGFGAQNLVRDYLAGILMLVEDHYGVGDTIHAKDATGTVEAMTLFTTRLRDVNGVVWHIRNGTLDSVGNESQGWSRAVIDYPVPYGEDLNRIRQLMDQAADSMYREPGWREVMLEKPEVWGAQELSSKEVTMRIVAKTAPMQQWKVARELRARVKAELDAAGIAPAGPDTIVITAPSGPGDQAEAGVAEPVVAERLAEAGVAERLAEPAGAEPAGAEPAGAEPAVAEPAVAERLAEEEGSGGAGTP